jgi:hypothetical protein
MDRPFRNGVAMACREINVDQVHAEKKDIRDQMEFEETIINLDPTQCSSCRSKGAAFFATKHFWRNQPSGHLLTRCPDCFADSRMPG